MVKFNLYSIESGEPLIYTFPIVSQANYPHTEKKLIEHENVRGKGSIIISGGDSAWDLTLRGVLIGNDYDDLMDKVDELEEKVLLNEPFILKIESNTTTYEYNVKRILPVEYQEDNLRTNFIEYQVTLRVDCF